MRVGLWGNVKILPETFAKIGIGTLLLSVFVTQSIFIQAELPASARRAWATAISKEIWNLPQGYHKEISDQILQGGWEDRLSKANIDFVKNNKALKHAVDHKVILDKTVNRFREQSSAHSIFYRLSGQLMGWNVLGPALIIYGLLFISLLTFYFSLKTDKAAMCILGVVSISMAIINHSAPNMQELLAFHNSRGWSVLLAIPALQFVIYTTNPTRKGLIWLLLQFCLTIPALAVRPSSIWLVFMGCSLPAIILSLQVYKARRVILKTIGLLLLPGLALGILYLFLTQYVRKNDPEAGYSKWHSIGVGLMMGNGVRKHAQVEGCGPRSYKIMTQPTDLDCYRLVLKFLKSRTGENTKKYKIKNDMFVFDEEFNWHAYESDSREAILDLLRKCSITDLMLVEIQKTFQFIIALLVPGWGPSWELLFLIPLVPICNKAIAAAQIQRETIIKPICIGLGFSLLPMLAAYPQPHGLVEQYVFLTSLFFLLSPILLSHLLKKFNWKDQAKKT
jgi:hypothetical protein